MYKLEKDSYSTYKEFFFAGIDESGENQLFDAFLYFSYVQEIRKKYIEEQPKSIIYMPDTRSLPIDNRPKYSREERAKQSRQWKKQFAFVSEKPTGEEILEETIQRAKKIALQYDRFITLNNKNKVIANYNKTKSGEREKELEERLRGVARAKIEDGSIQIDEYDIKLSKGWMERYIHFPEYSIKEYPKDYIIRNWTEEVYDILKFLEKSEQYDPKGYYDIWLRTRIKRFETEIERSNKKIKGLREKDAWKNEEEIRSLEKIISENEEEIKLLKPIADKVKELRRKEDTIGVKNENPIIREFDVREI